MTSFESSGKGNCPLATGLRPCQCDLPRCPECGYTQHDAEFEMDHERFCGGKIPPAKARARIATTTAELERLRALEGCSR